MDGLQSANYFPMGADSLSGNTNAFMGFASNLASMLPQSPPNYVPTVTSFANNLSQQFTQNVSAAENFQTGAFSNSQKFFQPLFQQQQSTLKQVGMAQAQALQTAGQAAASAAGNSGGKK
jgi:hypothetical protein